MSTNVSSRSGRLVVVATIALMLAPSTVAAAREPAESDEVAAPQVAEDGEVLARRLTEADGLVAHPLAQAEAAGPMASAGDRPWLLQVPIAVDPADVPAPAEAEHTEYLVGDWELQDVPLRQLRFGSGPAPSRRRVRPHDGDGVPLRPFGKPGNYTYNPTVLAQEGLRQLHGFRKTRDKVFLRRAKNIARRLNETARIRGLRWQPHHYPRLGNDPGWVNANSHGLVMSFFSRYYRITGDKRKLRVAARLLPAFDNRPSNARWIAMVTKRGNIWFEHWPDGRPTHVLNAHINALFGLYEYWRESGSPQAELLLQGGLRTVRDTYDRFRREGRLSRYSLSSNWGTADYHRTHIEQLRVLRHITGDDWFGRMAKQLERDQVAWRRTRSG